MGEFSGFTKILKILWFRHQKFSKFQVCHQPPDFGTLPPIDLKETSILPLEVIPGILDSCPYYWDTTGTGPRPKVTNNMGNHRDFRAQYWRKQGKLIMATFKD